MDDKRLRLKIEESAEKRIVSANLLYCCIAALNNKINVSQNEQHILKSKRDILSRVAIYELNIDKVTLANAIRKLSDGCCPSLKAVDRVLDMISRGYIVDNSFIPDNWMQYKSDEEVATIAELPQPKPKEKRYVIPDNTFREVCALIESEYNIEMDDSCQRELVKASGEYSFDVVLKAFQWEKKSIRESLCGKDFKSTYAKYKYILAVVKNHLADTQKKIKNRERQQKQAEEAIERELRERRHIREDVTESETELPQCKKKERWINPRLEELW